MGHVAKEFKGKSACHKSEDKRHDYEPMNQKPREYCPKVPTHILENTRDVLNFKELGGNEGADGNWREPITADFMFDR